MPVEFIGKEIQVTLSDEAVRRPVSFRLGGKKYTVAEVLTNWQDHDFGSISPGLRGWRAQHHRNYYRLRTVEGDVFEIYADWMATRRQRKSRPERSRWYAYRRISGPPEAEKPQAPPTQPQTG